jgi:hypothetical protein
MKVMPLALCATLILILSSTGPIPFVGNAAAQQQGESREALYVRCRTAVFKKYASRQFTYAGRKLVMLSQNATNLVDQCVANGGRVI